MNQYIKESVSRFLGWKLPADFAPDAGITFKSVYNETSPFGPSTHEPTGTNLFNDPQVTAMLTHVCKPLTDRIVELGDESNHLRAVAKTAISFLKDGEVKMVDRITELEALSANLKQEAQIHAMEAKNANATINEINQFISGATGEPANWHGAQPVKDFVNALKAQLADAKQVANDCRIVADNAIAEAKNSQWQPIATAPMDGSLILLWNPKEPNLSKFGKWARHLAVGDFHWTSPKSISYSNLPTHWMPLPAVPVIQS